MGTLSYWDKFWLDTPIFVSGVWVQLLAWDLESPSKVMGLNCIPGKIHKCEVQHLLTNCNFGLQLSEVNLVCKNPHSHPSIIYLQQDTLNPNPKPSRAWIGILLYSNPFESINPTWMRWFIARIFGFTIIFKIFVNTTKDKYLQNFANLQSGAVSF